MNPINSLLSLPGWSVVTFSTTEKYFQAWSSQVLADARPIVHIDTMPYAFTEHHWNWSDIELAPLFVSDYWHTAQEAISSRGEVSIGWNRTQRKFHHLQQANEAPVSVPTADFDEFVFEIELQQ
jgi:ribonuclease HI